MKTQQHNGITPLFLLATRAHTHIHTPGSSTLLATRGRTRAADCVWIESRSSCGYRGGRIITVIAGLRSFQALSHGVGSREIKRRESTERIEEGRKGIRQEGRKRGRKYKKGEGDIERFPCSRYPVAQTSTSQTCRFQQQSSSESKPRAISRVLPSFFSSLLALLTSFPAEPPRARSHRIGDYARSHNYGNYRSRGVTDSAGINTSRSRRY